MSGEAKLALHQHGKGKVRVARKWVEDNKHYLVEWSVNTMLESDMSHSFLHGSNEGMTATDTQKNTVYYVAKQCSKRCSAEEYAIMLGRHFVKTYPLVTKCKVSVEQAPWTRAIVQGKEHVHGYSMTGTELRTVYVTVDKKDNISVTSGVRGMRVLKTTQSGYEGFLHDKYTILKDTNERMMASSVTATWRYSSTPKCYDAAFAAAKSGLVEAFLGPPDKGVYSPAVQTTLYQMGQLAMKKVPEIDSIFLNMPNIHFLPCTPVTSKFEDDVYIATSEPHGDIEATIVRGSASPHARL